MTKILKSTTDKLAGTCSVCLRPMQLHGDHPIRHGFSAVGVRHGAHSGYHTGPCGGLTFPHLGISTVGTQWALKQARERLVGVNEDLRKLESKPDLTWYPSSRGLPDIMHPVVLRPGEDVGYAVDGRPTYAWELKKRVTAATNIKDELDRAIAEYDRVISTWSPEKYAVTGAAKKIETVHMATPRKSLRGEWIGILCRFTRMGGASSLAKKTEDPSKVTCKRCRVTLGLPPL